MNENKGTNIDIYCLINILGFAIQKNKYCFPSSNHNEVIIAY